MDGNSKGSAQPTGSEGQLRSKVELGTAVVALITAIAGGIFGLTANQAKTEAQGQAATSDAKVQTVTSQINDLERKLTDAQSKVEDLQSQLSDPSETATTGGAKGSTIFHSGILNLPTDYNVDLDAPASDPQWGVQGGYGGDSYWYDGDLTPTSGASALEINGPATYENCRTTTGYSTQAITLKYLDAGTHICIKTDQDRYSIVTVRKTPTADSTLELKIVTFTSLN